MRQYYSLRVRNEKTSLAASKVIALLADENLSYSDADAALEEATSLLREAAFGNRVTIPREDD